MEGIERFFIEKYNELEKERDALRARVSELDGDLTSKEFGITDLHKRYNAVRGKAASVSTIKSYYVEKAGLEKARETAKLTDDELFSKFKNKSLSYYTAIDYEEKNSNTR